MKQFFKLLIASTVGTVIGFFLFTILAVLIMVGIIGSAMNTESSEQDGVKPNSILVVDLSTNLLERKQDSPFEELDIEGVEETHSMELRTFKERIADAKADENIKGIYLKGKMFNGSFATMEYVREVLVDFKESGKFILAYDEFYTQGAYYIATAADEVYVFEEGMIELYGLRSEIPFFKGMLDKIGIEAVVLKGPDNIYKSAVEPFTREDMSEASREQIQRIVDHLWSQMAGKIAVSRNITVDEVNRIANDLSVRQPEDLVELGLCDDAVYYDEILLKMREKLALAEADELEMIEMTDYNGTPKDEDDQKSWELNEEIALVYAIGGIGDGEGDHENIGSESLSESIREAREDEDIKAIVMRVNSPGGSALSSDVIWREVKLAAAEKPFIVSFGDVAASGGYYISTHAHRIFASPASITGSIGVFGLIPDARKLMSEKLGITFDNVKTNEHADFGSLKRGFDEAEMALLNEYVTRTYNEFVERVADGRKMSVEDVDSIARGRVWVGTDALEIGLVDEMGGLDEAIAYAAQQAGLENYDLRILPEAKDPWEAFFESFSENARYEVASWILDDELKLFRQVEDIRNMDRIQARMLYDFSVN